MQPIATSKSASRGTALVELVIVLPILLLFLIAIVNLGIALAQMHNLQRVVYEGATYASSVPGMANTASRDRVLTFLHRLVGLTDQSRNVYQPVPPTLQVTYTGSTSSPPLPSTSIYVSAAGHMDTLLGLQLPFRVSSVTPYFLAGGGSVSNYQIFENPIPMVGCQHEPGGSSSSPCPP